MPGGPDVAQAAQVLVGSAVVQPQTERVQRQTAAGVEPVPAGGGHCARQGGVGGHGLRLLHIEQGIGRMGQHVLPELE